MHSNHDFEATTYDVVAKLVPSHSSRQTARGTKWGEKKNRRSGGWGGELDRPGDYRDGRGVT